MFMEYFKLCQEPKEIISTW